MITRSGSSRLALLAAVLLSVAMATPLAAAADGGASAIDELARDTERVESIRAVKNLQYAYSHYAQFGLWAEMGALFSSEGEFIWGDVSVKGPPAIARYNMETYGEGKPGLPYGSMNTLFVEVPLINLSSDGNSAKVRWYGLHMLGGGANARWEGGTYQNEYVREKGVWKISRLHFFPQYGGLYAAGMRVLNNPLPLVPYHFNTPAVAGTPIAPPDGKAPRSSARLSDLEGRIDVLNAEDKVRNLQYAHGYYMDRKMWDDVADLFSADGVWELVGTGVYSGSAAIRQALERDGPSGLKRGQLNDRPLFDTLIEVSRDGLEARARGLELGMIGDHDSGTAHWTVRVFDNRFVKRDGVWRIREMRVFPILKTDYYQGWGKSWIAESAGGVIPALMRHPVTGREPVYPAGATVARSRLLPLLPTRTPALTKVAESMRVAEAARRLAVSKAYDGAMNMTASYSFYLDDGQWTSLGGAFAERGAKQVPFVGFYIGPERIAHRTGATPAVNSTNPGRGGWHWLMQTVVDVAADGRSAKMRSRLFHPLPSNNGGSIEAGMYPNNQAVLENGVWKLWSVTIDEAYFSAPHPYGWSRSPPPRGGASPTGVAPSQATGASTVAYPPDFTLAAIGKRMEGFIGGPGQSIRWPEILPMWFHYKNPVSGREPELYWPNCGSCEHAPETSMDRHGYLLP